MSKFLRLKKTFSKIDIILERNRVLLSVRQGLTLMIPLLLVGSFALILLSLPIPAYQAFMKYAFGSNWGSIFVYIQDSTFGILSLIMVLCISYSYTNDTIEIYNSNISPIIASVVSLCSFIALSGISKEGFSIAKFGAIGLFFAIVVSITSSMIFIKLCSFRILQIKSFTEGANSIFSNAITSIYPAAITILIFAACDHIITSIFGISDIQNFISDIITSFFLKLGSSVWSALLFIFLTHFFWFLGLHGNNILESVAVNMFVPALSVNIKLIQEHQLPTEIFTKTFFDTFVFLGGCGGTLCLICAILISAKYKNLRRHAKMSAFPVLFNVNELIIFGVPIVLNPIYIIPFIFIPVLFTLTSYLAMLCNLVPYTQTSVEWTTPIFLSGYTATNSLQGSVLQLFNLSIGTLCYIPFVKITERKTATQMSNSLKKLVTRLNKNEEQGVVSSFTTRNDEIGYISRLLIADLEHTLQNSKLSLFYQPQVNHDDRIFGFEALLRWKHEIYGYIYPPLIIALAEEAKLTHQLGYWIIDTACRDFKELINRGFNNLTLSVNISAHQLKSDNFINELEQIITFHQIKPHMLKIEITEQVALGGTKKIMQQLQSIKELGLKLAMDDFGAGHSSLKYLKEYEFDTVKIDGSLVREILTNNTCKNIISSIVFLSKSINFSIISEFVETEEQRNELHRLGCDQYQGYLYSPAIPFDEFINYLQIRKEEKPF